VGSNFIATITLRAQPASIHRTVEIARLLTSPRGAVRFSPRDLCLTLIAVVLIVLPAAGAATMVARYGIDVPYYDQWVVIAPLLASQATGGPAFSALLSAHNEHRPFFPRVIFLTLAYLTNWNVKYEMVLTWLAVCATSAGLWALQRRTLHELTPRSRTGLMIAANVFLFCPIQFESLLWGFQLSVVLPATATVLAVAAASGRWREDIRGAVCGLLALVSTLSTGNGVLTWCVTWPALAMAPTVSQRHRRLALWLFPLAGGIVIGAYLHGYHLLSGRLPDAVLVNAIGAIHFLVVFIGAPFGRGTIVDPVVLATWAGVIELGVVVAATGMAVCGGPDLRRRATPWLMIATFVVLSGALAASARVSEGVQAAMAFRYASLPLLLPAVVVNLVPLAASGIARWPRPHAAIARLRGALLTAALLLCALNGVVGLSHARELRTARLADKAAVLFVDFASEDDFRRTWPFWPANIEGLRRIVHAMDRVGFVRPGIISSRDVRPLAFGGSVNVSGLPIAHCGVMDSVAADEENDGYHLGGWTIRNWGGHSTDAVVLTYDSADGASIMVAVAEVSHERVRLRGSRSTDAFARWERILARGTLPVQPAIVRAWAFDTSTGSVCQLVGGPQIPW
jgi:hypothetical protein